MAGRVRDQYGIRTSLAKSMLESQIQLGGNVSLSVAKKPLTLATFIYLMLAVVGFALIFSNTKVHYGGPWGISLFVIGYMATYAALLTRTRTIDYRINYIPVMIRYWRRGGRVVNAGLLDAGGPLKNFLGIEPKNGVDPNGLIHFTDGEVGLIYDVVGNASTMIFLADQKLVIRDARTVYKNIPSTCGITVITQASSQDVHLQVQSKLDQLHKLKLPSPGLRQVIKKQGQILQRMVGREFSMIRQYLLIRGKPELVQVASREIEQAAHSSSNVFLKSATRLTDEPVRKGVDGLPLNEPYQVEKLLATIFNDYQGR